MTAEPAENPGARGFVHAGIVVDDLNEVVRFLSLLGLACTKANRFAGEWIERIIDVTEVDIEVVMAKAPGDDFELEVVKFHSPSAAPAAFAPANTPGIRHLLYKVGDLRATTDRLIDAGWPLLGEIVNYEEQYLLCYVKGPEGLIFELAEQLGNRAAT